VIWLFPTNQVFGDEIFIYTPKKNYTANDSYQLLLDAQANDSAKIWKDIESFFSWEAPGVSTTCFIGYNVSTMKAVYYSDQNLNNEPKEIVNSDGDGTVLTPSLEFCGSWESQQSQPVNLFRVPNMVHGSAVHNKYVITSFLNILGIQTEQ